MAEGDRYTSVAIILHWLIAAAIIGLLFVGLTMKEKGFYPQDVQFQMFQLHKSFGLSVLVLSVLRLVWRLLHKPPALPSDMPAWEVFAAKSTHWAFYALMFALPLTGWALVSTSPFAFPTYWFGLFEWPHLGLSFLGPQDSVYEASSAAHEWLAYILMALLAIHVGAALKHYVWNRDNVVSHMIPVLKPLRPKNQTKS